MTKQEKFIQKMMEEYFIIVIINREREIEKKEEQNSNVSECIHVHAATTEILGLEMTLRIRK